MTRTSETWFFSAVLTRVEELLGVALLTVIAVTVLIGILFRSVNVSVPWVEDVSKFALAGLTFIGVSIGIRKNSHVSFTTFTDVLPKSFSSVLSVVHSAAWLACLWMLFQFGWGMLHSYLVRGIMTASLGINTFWLRLPFLIGLLLSLVRVLEKCWLTIHELRMNRMEAKTL